MAGAESRPRPLGLTHLEERTLYHFEQLKKNLEWKDDKPPDPYEIYQALAHIALEVQPASFLGEVGAPDQEVFTENMQNVRDAFGLAASPYMSERGKLFMRTSHGWRKGELAITPQQKRMLTMITTAAGIPDDPARLSYPYSMALRPRELRRGQGQGQG